jgi:2,3-dihydroxybenzoate-AMP ligase
MNLVNDIVPWPEEAISRYRALDFWRKQTFPDLLGRWAVDFGERTAIVSGTTRYTYSELAERARRLAAGLRRLGIVRGERVVVQLPNVPELIILTFALFHVGAIPVFALAAHRRSEITYLCGFAEAVAYVIPDHHNGFDHRELASEVLNDARGLRHVIVVGEPGPFAALEELYSNAETDLVAPAPGDVALFQLSGGTTGLPKLIPRLHEEYAYSVRASAELCGLASSSAYLAMLPIAHNFPMSSPGFLGTLYAGGKVVLAQSASPEEAFPLIEREQVTIAALVPPLVLRWLEAVTNGGCRPPKLGLLQVGGARLAPEVARRITPTLGCQLQQVFGMAEGLVNYTRLGDPEATVIGTQGRPLSPADELRIVDELGNAVAADEVGELLTRGPYTIRGYYRAHEYNQRAFTGDGYYRTGDLVRQTADGYLVVEGRAKDQINRGGDKVSAEELENHLLAHDGVHNAAVVAMPDEELGERTCAFVVASRVPLRLRELRRFLVGRGIASFKLPDRLELVAELPRTAVGKIDKRELRHRISTLVGAERSASQKADEG